MSLKSENIRLPPEYDRRRRLTDDQKDEIKHKYSTGLYSLNNLAKEYSVSKKTVMLIVNSESKRKNDERIKEYWRDYQPTSDERNKIMREYRQYKRNLHKEGKI